MDHDQNFKNLALDYPREALAFCAEAEARAITPDVRITPVREEQCATNNTNASRSSPPRSRA